METINKASDSAKHELEGNADGSGPDQTTEAKRQLGARNAVSYAGEVVVPKIVSPPDPRLDPIANGL